MTKELVVLLSHTMSSEPSMKLDMLDQTPLDTDKQQLDLLMMNMLPQLLEEVETLLIS